MRCRAGRPGKGRRPQRGEVEQRGLARGEGAAAGREEEGRRPEVEQVVVHGEGELGRKEKGAGEEE